MDAKAVHRAAQQALKSQDGYFVTFERLTGLTPTQVSTYHRIYEGLSEEDRADLRRRHGIGTFHAYLADRLADGVGL